MNITKAHKVNSRLLLTLTAALIAAAPILSHAADAASVGVKVSFADLNPGTIEGAQRLYSRIEQAANTACGTSNMDTDVIMRGPGPCVRGAVARAVKGVKSPTLAQVYIEKNGLKAANEFGITRDVLAAKN